MLLTFWVVFGYFGVKMVRMVRMVRMVIPDTFGCYQSEWFVSSTCGSPPSWMGLF